MRDRYPAGRYKLFDRILRHQPELWSKYRATAYNNRTIKVTKAGNRFAYTAEGYRRMKVMVRVHEMHGWDVLRDDGFDTAVIINMLRQWIRDTSAKRRAKRELQARDDQSY